MVFFIVSTVAYILGMSLASYLEIQSSFIFLVLSILFVAGSVIPFWSRHGDLILAGRFREIFHEEEALPATSMLFFLLAIFFFGVFRYVFALYPMPANHLDRVMSSDNPFTKYTVVGRIIEEPTLKQDYLEVLIQPETVQEFVKAPKATSMGKKGGKSKGKSKSKSKGKNKPAAPVAAPAAADDGEEPSGSVAAEPPPEIRIDGGMIQAKVYEDSRAFAQMKFNQRIQVTGRFSVPSSRRNPGSLDYQRSLINKGIFRTTRLTSKEGIFKELGSAGYGSPWYRFALYLRAECLKVIKQTIPYPESSFLGGVLLGLRGGVPPHVIKEFRMTGVSHVLAVSGLHVTIIAGLLYGLFTAFRVPLKVFAPFICFFLFTFALIVGWPSSAVRAALMNSLFVLARAYLRDLGFKQSIVFALALAGCYILTMAPLQLTEPSFTLSMMAIYALAMFTDSSEKFLRSCLRGAGLALTTTVILAFYLFLTVNRGIVLHEYFFWVTGAIFIVTFYVSHRLSINSSFQSFSFEMLPKWLQSFAAAQMAIFLGMMGPLSAFYFGTASLAAPLANMIAIPLIGLIVQLGMIAGIIGAFLPVFGVYIALILNAANWLAIKFFLGMAHFFALLIPFPRVSQPGFAELLAYYAILHLVFFHQTVRDYLGAIVEAIIEIWDDPHYRLPLGATLGVVFGGFFFLLIMGMSKVQYRPELRATLLDVGYGSSLLLERGDKAVLIDAGMADDAGNFDAGERTLEPALSGKNIRSVHAVVLTTMLPENITGLFRVMQNFKVVHLYAPFPIPTDGRTIGFHEFLERFSLADRKVEAAVKAGEVITMPPNYYWEQSFLAFNNLIKTVFATGVNVHLLRAGEGIVGMDGVIEFVHPREPPKRFNSYYDAAVVFIRHGRHAMAYASPNVRSWAGLADQPLNILFVAGIPNPSQDFLDFYQRAKPDHVAISFRKPPGWLMDRYYLGKILDGRIFQFNKKFRDWGKDLLRTDQNGAVQVDIIRDRLHLMPFVTSSGEL